MLKKLLALSAAALLTVASYVVAQELREDHPDTYVVQRGDTLWDIAGRFLRQPWLWPEIWQANPQIENPHLIYPGDVISLAYLGGRPTLQVVKRSPEVRRSDIDPVPAVPLSDVEAFLKRLHVLDEDELEGLPYVLALEENRLRGASGQIAYVRGLEGEPGSRWAFVRPHVRYVMHPHPTTDERRLRSDPWSAAHGVEPHQSGRMWAYYAASDNGFEVLGYELIEVGSGTVTRDGETSTLLIADDGREVKAGDLLLPVDDQPFDLMFHPRAPDRIPADMRVLAVTDGVAYSGPRHVVALSAGSRQGVANGQVYAIYNPGDLVRDEIAHPVRMSANRKKNKVQLPDEFGGHVMIFRTFDKVSYGLVMDGIRPIRVGDVAKRPVDL